ncbi:acyl-CoA dehydrogenase family protein [Fischerella sp. PCC 9605]|uniref:acyl-CoA dehydrogenase family protein n=1 Tax=Fischerella sp. PCC 9605 TaxID=1173024 RepID=UPI00047BA02F|nr:acyl-CoA dehydrogenase family protein [Fischerella sp. PCC 9605]
MQLLERNELKDYIAIATTVSKELAASAVERDLQAGIPYEEIQRLREAGLLPLVVPREYGGVGATWIEAFKIVQELAKADGSTGQLYANQIILSVLGQVAGTPAQAERYYRATAQNHLFWGNAVNARDTRLKIEPEDNHYRVNGIKTFGTGTIVADLRVFSAVQEGVDFPIIFVIPKDREGVVYNDDWKNMGQRRTASGSFTFHNVFVNPDEILGPPPSPEGAFSTFLFVVNQLVKTYVYLGIAEGAFEAAKEYTTTITRPWITSGVDRASKDPYILHHYGELWTELKAAIGLASQAAQQVQTAWDKGNALTHEERGEVAIAVSAAKAFATKVGLNITTRIFEVMGARSTATSYGCDRYWRDLRTFTLHDPVDYKLRDVGNWVLNRELPIVTQYS